MNRVLLAIFISAVFVAGALLYIYNPDPAEYKNPDEEPAFCTLDAKLCPDGSYVGRVPPSCEFAQCPATSTPIFEDGTILPGNDSSSTQPSNPPKNNEPVFCTMDAKLCPDGSYVGRIPPNCEFAQCPTTPLQ